MITGLKEITLSTMNLNDTVARTVWLHKCSTDSKLYTFGGKPVSPTGVRIESLSLKKLLDDGYIIFYRDRSVNENTLFQFNTIDKNENAVFYSFDADSDSSRFGLKKLIVDRNGLVGEEISRFILSDGGSSSIKVIPHLDEGVRIATIKLENSNYDIYAPEGNTFGPDESGNLSIPGIMTASDFVIYGQDTTLSNLNETVEDLSTKFENLHIPTINVEPIVTSGKHIATITIDGSPTEIFTTNAAKFISSFNTYDEMISADVESLSVENNDYAVVRVDETHGGQCWRYVYVNTDSTTSAHWQPEYEVNEPDFTAEQQAAIDSGITSALVGDISTNKSKIQEIEDSLPSYLPLSGFKTVTGLVSSDYQGEYIINAKTTDYGYDEEIVHHLALSAKDDPFAEKYYVANYYQDWDELPNPEFNANLSGIYEFKTVGYTWVEDPETGEERWIERQSIIKMEYEFHVDVTSDISPDYLWFETKNSNEVKATLNQWQDYGFSYKLWIKEYIEETDDWTELNVECQLTGISFILRHESIDIGNSIVGSSFTFNGFNYDSFECDPYYMFSYVDIYTGTFNDWNWKQAHLGYVVTDSVLNQKLPNYKTNNSAIYEHNAINNKIAKLSSDTISNINALSSVYLTKAMAALNDPEHFAIPETVYEFNDGRIVLSNQTVVDIGDNNLTRIAIGTSVSAIGERITSDSLTSLYVPDTVRSNTEYRFIIGGNSLEKIRMPDVLSAWQQLYWLGNLKEFKTPMLSSINYAHRINIHAPELTSLTITDPKTIAWWLYQIDSPKLTKIEVPCSLSSDLRSGDTRSKYSLSSIFSNYENITDVMFTDSDNHRIDPRALIGFNKLSSLTIGEGISAGSVADYTESPYLNRVDLPSSWHNNFDCRSCTNFEELNAVKVPYVISVFMRSNFPPNQLSSGKLKIVIPDNLYNGYIEYYSHDVVGRRAIVSCFVSESDWKYARRYELINGLSSKADISTIVFPSDTNPKMDGVTADPGVAETFSRSDHVHPKDSSKMNLSAVVSSDNIAINARDGLTYNVLSGRLSVAYSTGLNINETGYLQVDENKIASRQFVTDLIQGFSTFISSFNTLSDLHSYETSGLHNNDYAFVLTDESHGGQCSRYIWSDEGWQYQFKINDTFTETQMSAINSGATKDKIDSIANKAEQVVINNVHYNSSNGIIDLGTFDGTTLSVKGNSDLSDQTIESVIINLDNNVTNLNSDVSDLLTSTVKFSSLENPNAGLTLYRNNAITFTTKIKDNSGAYKNAVVNADGVRINIGSDYESDPESESVSIGWPIPDNNTTFVTQEDLTEYVKKSDLSVAIISALSVGSTTVDYDYRTAGDPDNGYTPTDCEELINWNRKLHSAFINVLTLIGADLPVPSDNM